MNCNSIVDDILIAKRFCFSLLATRLNEYIHHYEPLDYDTNQVLESHHRVRRWVTGDGGSWEPEVHLEFRAHRRHFKLRLKRDAAVFSPSLQVEGDAVERNEVDTSHIYAGTLEGTWTSFILPYMHRISHNTFLIHVLFTFR